MDIACERGQTVSGLRRIDGVFNVFFSPMQTANVINKTSIVEIVAYFLQLPIVLTLNPLEGDICRLLTAFVNILRPDKARQNVFCRA